MTLIGSISSQVLWAIKWARSLMREWILRFSRILPRYEFLCHFVSRYVVDASQMIHNIPRPAFEELIAARIAKGGKVEVRKNHSFLKRSQACILLCDLASAGC